MDGQTRRQFLRRSGMAAVWAAMPAGGAGMEMLRFAQHDQSGSRGERPNILWLTSEDNSPYLGCYGDEQAKTANLDALAAQGVRYRNAFANAPVCSAARSTLITGMHACSLGIHNHRSQAAIPRGFEAYPVYMRRAGYYCTNNSKMDYNCAGVGAEVWDQCSAQAHYKNRNPGQPFFAIFNSTLSHEGQLTYQIVENRRKSGVLPAKPRITPQDVKLPPYHADTEVVRRDWSVYYDNMTAMDAEMGRHLKELEQAGLADDTIVFYYSDHGGALPRGKRNIHDSGTRVPLIVRFPKKWAHLAPARPGGWVEQPVSFVDFPATVLSLMGIEIPRHFEGRAFLGPRAGEPRDHVFLFRGRMDERYDTVRAIRDRRYRYIRNYSPHRPWGQQYSYPFQVMPSMGSWYQAYREGRCNAVQARYWQPKPSEELYDTQGDPHEVKNLADDPTYAEILGRMRGQLRADIIRMRDTGFIAEGMCERLAGADTLYEYAQSDAYPIERIVDMADVVVSRDVSRLGRLIEAAGDPHPVIRYWAATGCLILEDRAKAAEAMLERLLTDDWADVRAAAAEAISFLGREGAAAEALEAVIRTDGGYAALAGLNALDFMHQGGRITLGRILKMIDGVEFKPPADRMAEYFRRMKEPARESV